MIFIVIFFHVKRVVSVKVLGAALTVNCVYEPACKCGLIK